LEDPPNCAEVALRRPVQRQLDRGFDGPLRLHVEPTTLRGQAQERPASVRRVLLPSDHAPPFETRQDAGEGTRVKVKEIREASSRHSWRAPEDPNHEPLRARDANRPFHALRNTLERVVDRPEQAHELQHAFDRTAGGVAGASLHRSPARAATAWNLAAAALRAAIRGSGLEIIGRSSSHRTPSGNVTNTSPGAHVPRALSVHEM
jgi:hypothetical protein